MKTIVLLSCVKKKKNYRCEARELYDSTLFKYSLQYAEKLCPDRIFILSALHGVLELDKFIEPYNVTLKNMRTAEKREWAQKVIQQLQEKGVDLCKDNFVFLAGEEYRKYLLPHIRHYEVPLQGLKLGPRLAYLRRLANE